MKSIKLKDLIKEWNKSIPKEKRWSKPLSGGLTEFEKKGGKDNIEEKENPGLWANIHAKRKRGESPAKPGDSDYPDTLDLDEDNFDKITIPANVKRWMNRFIDSMNSVKLERMKKIAILFQVIKALGLNPQELNTYIQRIRRGLK